MKKIKQNDYGFAYTGDIKITVYKNNVIVKQVEIHNEGLSPLFKYLVLALAGTANQGNRPQLLRIFQDKDYKQPILDFGLLSDGDPVINVQSSPALASITFRFIIPETLAVGKMIRGIQLTDGLGNIFAQANNEAAEIVKAGTNVALEWRLTLANYKEN